MSPKKEAVDPVLQALAEPFAKKIKTQADLDDFSKLLKKMTIEAALRGETETYLAYAKHSVSGHRRGNSHKRV